MSIIDPLTCGFAKVAVFSLLSNPTNLQRLDKEKATVFKSREFKYRYDKFHEIFKDNEDFRVAYQHFTWNFPKIKDNIQLLGKILYAEITK